MPSACVSSPATVRRNVVLPAPFGPMTTVSSMWARWPLLLGVAFVIVVLFFRGGVVEAWARFWAWRASHRVAPAAAGADGPR